MPKVVACVVAGDGVSVDPCGTIDGIAHAPAVMLLDNVDIANTVAGDLFVQALSITVIAFAVGIVVGSIMRLIRSV